jgi:para-nitrobenzyl esterase
VGGTRHRLGIQYATAARFEPPQPVPWDGDPTREGDFGPAAPQSREPDLIPGMHIGASDEADCLSLNVWAPQGADRLPVLVWFHGGSFVLGASSQSSYDGARLAEEQQVVVVSANYRLGALGFLDTRSIGGRVANLGLHDALCALRWVAANIEAFGGDAHRITMFGESAGGGVVVHLLASGSTNGLVTGAIVQSGITDRTLDSSAGATVARALCDAAGVDDLDGLRALSTEQILRAQTAAVPSLLRPIGMMPFHPVVDGDLLVAPPAAALRDGAAAGVRLLAGTTADEMALFLDPAAVAPDPERLRTRVAKYVGVTPTAARSIVARYEAEAGADGAWPALFSDVEMQVPLRRVLEAHAPHGPTFAYLFTWEAPGRGAFHAVDIPFTFDTFDVDGWGEFVGCDDDARALGRSLRTSWAAFARRGDPGWSPYPETRVFGRATYDAPRHPLFDRQQDYWRA